MLEGRARCGDIDKAQHTAVSQQRRPKKIDREAEESGKKILDQEDSNDYSKEEPVQVCEDCNYCHHI